MNTRESVDLLKPYLRQYMALVGIEVDRNNHFRCPAHDDKHPSANIIPGTDDTEWWCQVCQVGGNVCHMCHYVENRPRSGAGWFTENVCYLAKLFNLDIKPERELSGEEQRKAEIYRAYADASRLLMTMKKSDRVQAKLADYGWSKRTLRTFGIGGVESYDAYLAAMAKLGWSKDFLKEIDLDNWHIFQPECLIYTVKDELGRPVAFSARHLLYEKLKAAAEKALAEKGESSEEYQNAWAKVPQKYYNTANRNPIYRKRATLFGMHAARQSNSRTLFVFEGNADAATAHNAGLVNAVAVCANKFTDEHLTLAIETGIKHLVYAMDADAGGDSGMRAFVQLIEAKSADVRVELIALPAGTDDPDLFIRTRGLKPFLALKRQSVFRWKTGDAIARGEDRLETAAEAEQLIIAQADPLIRYQMVRELEDATGIPEATLWQSVYRFAQSRSDAAAQELCLMFKAMEALVQAPAPAKAILEGKTDLAPKTEPAPEKPSATLPAATLGPLVPVAPRPTDPPPPETKEDRTAKNAELWK